MKDQPQTLHFPPEASWYSRLGACNVYEIYTSHCFLKNWRSDEGVDERAVGTIILSAMQMCYQETLSSAAESHCRHNCATYKTLYYEAEDWIALIAHFSPSLLSSSNWNCCFIQGAYSLLVLLKRVYLAFSGNHQNAFQVKERFPGFYVSFTQSDTEVARKEGKLPVNNWKLSYQYGHALVGEVLMGWWLD